MGFGDRLAAGSGALLVVSVLFLPWFAISAHGDITIGSEAGAFRWLDTIAAVLLACGLASAALPVLRGAGMIGWGARDVSVIVASAGLATLSLVAYRIAVPPEAGGDFLLQAGLDPAVHVTPRIGAVVGLFAGIGMLIGGVMSTLDLGDKSLPSHEPAGRAGTIEERPKPTSRRTRRSTGQRPRLSAATEDDLRRLGLSPTQARRVIRYRDELGLISVPTDIDVVPGIPPALRAAVKERLRT